jgi:hypothetical protein
MARRESKPLSDTLVRLWGAGGAVLLVSVVLSLVVSVVVGLVISVGVGFGFGVGALVVSVGIGSVLERQERRQAERLAAGLASEAQLETARAIREVNRELEEASPLFQDQPAPQAPPPQAPGAEWAPKPSATWHELPDRAGVPESAGIAGAVDRFYTQALLHANVWFLASVLAAIVGLAVIVWEVIQASGRPDLEAGLKATTGLLVEAVAALFYRQANATRKHAGDLLTSTQGDRRAETARQILATIEDDRRREEIAARLVMHLAGAPAPRGRSAAPTRRSTPVQGAAGDTSETTPGSDC